MKKILVTLGILMVTLASFGQRGYYVSSAGSDLTGNGTIMAPYQSISKINTIYSSFAVGDSVLFRKGDTFIGSLVVNKTGTPAKFMYIGSYGTGANPILTGMVPLTGWSNGGSGNIWSSAVQILKQNVNILTWNNIPQEIGRTDWMTYQTATPTTLTSTAINGTVNYLNAEVVIRKNGYRGEKAKVTVQSGNTITYIQTVGIDNGGRDAPASSNGNLKFFFQRFPGSLNAQGEWYYDSTTHRMMIYSTTNPTTAVKASAYDTIINTGGRAYIKIENINIEGGGFYGVSNVSGTNITINNCNFNNNTRAVHLYSTADVNVTNNTLWNNFCSGIFVAYSISKRINILNNTIRNTGQFIGNGLFWSDNNLKAIGAFTNADPVNNFVNVIGNVIRNTGHAPIQFQGSNVLIKNNVIDTFCNVLDDNGAIYTYGENKVHFTTNYVNRIVEENIMGNAMGAPISGSAADCAALYGDDQTFNVIWRFNTVYNIPGAGIQLNTPVGNYVYNNTFWNCHLGIAINKYTHTGDTDPVLFNNAVKYNIVYQKDSTQNILGHFNNNLNSPSTITKEQSMAAMADIDSNWISNYKFRSYYFLLPSPFQQTFYTLAQMRATPFFHEIHSVLPPITQTNTNTHFYYNQTGATTTANFPGETKKDPKGNIYNNFAPIPRYSGIILMDNGLTNQAPTVTAISDRVITLPTNSVNLTSSGSDVDGTFTTQWTRLSGPNTPTIVTPAAANTTINGLIQGIYQFQVTVTDNLGATGSDVVQVTVNAAPNNAPVANAGPDRNITLPTSNTTLDGSLTTDSDVGDVITYGWTKIGGPATYTIVSPTSATTSITGLIEGTYTFVLTVTDNHGATTSDLVVVTVNPAVTPPNPNPVANAGPDFIITLPTNLVHVDGSASTDNGSISAYNWTKLSGPATFTIVNPNSVATDITGLVQGVYVFQLLVTDNLGATNTNTMQVTVNRAPNQLPVVSAGSNVILNLPDNSTTVTATASDAEGSVTYQWTKTSGPGTFTIVNPTFVSTVINNLVEGIYTFTVTVTDTDGATASSSMQITVNNPTNNAPVADAGPSKSKTYPTDTVNVYGNGVDVDGTIASYAWSFASGPGPYTIVSPTSQNTLITGLIPGLYKFRLTVTDNRGATATDDVFILINEPIPGTMGDKLICNCTMKNIP